MSVPKLRFSEFSGEWEEKKLNEVGIIVTGATPPTNVKENFKDGEYLWVTPGDISNSKYVKKTDRNLTQRGINNGRLIQKNSVLVTCIGATIGKLCILPEHGSCNQQINAITPFDDFSSDFIYYSIQKYPERLKNYAGLTATPILNKNSFGKIRYNFPKSKEQRKIASFLSKIDSKIDFLEKKQEQWENYKKGMMQQIFSQKLRFKDENGEDYPDWEEKKLINISESLDNLRKPLNSDEREKMQGDIPYYGANGIVDCINNYIFDEPLVLLAEDGGNFDDFQNRPIAQLIKGKSWVNNHAHVLRSGPSIYVEFLFYSLVHKDIRKYINGTSRSKLNKKDMLSIEIRLPVLNEQFKIVSLLLSIDSKVNQLGKECKINKKFKKGLLQQMFC